MTALLFHLVRALLLTTVLLAAVSCGDHNGTAASQTGTANHLAETSPAAADRLDLNTATAAELAKLPGIGPETAERIVEHRTTFGPFRRPEHVMLIRGISEKRFRSIEPLITVK